MFYADLHVHSNFSRATSRDCDLEHLGSRQEVAEVMHEAEAAQS